MSILNPSIGTMGCILAVFLSGCSTSTPMHPSTQTSTWLLGKTQCRNIGCGRNLNFYPNEENGGQIQPRLWYGFDWRKDNITPTNNPYIWNTPPEDR